ncbi:restriction-modification system control element Bcll [[Clostridium] methylpentosum DSM 5476]|jgi:transcriptional regulator with XRE-family HTH domain|uniref:Restriction-modification system control element Bcll n=1 Tax=[Clostridium] methylpentosum DSM 5476 TaxID=537013 RepID=C0E8U3_9FIRM|nr:restriction-modification system control element Bcll [[Clostridium] methylpentosum DSM 5476]
MVNSILIERSGDLMEIKKIFGENIKKYRKQKSFSQEKLAELSGLHRTYISAVECGRRSISLNNIEKIADALEVETYQLFVR